MMQNYKNQQKSLVYCSGPISLVFDDKIVKWRQKAWKRQKSWKSVLFVFFVLRAQICAEVERSGAKAAYLWLAAQKRRKESFFNFFVVFKLFWRHLTIFRQKREKTVLNNTTYEEKEIEFIYIAASALKS